MKAEGRSFLVWPTTHTQKKKKIEEKEEMKRWKKRSKEEKHRQRGSPTSEVLSLTAGGAFCIEFGSCIFRSPGGINFECAISGSP